jgi:chromosome segregation ATPase
LLEGKFMSNNFDETQTKPTIETVLERINLLGNNLQGKLSSLQSDVDILKTDVVAVKTDVGSLKTDVGSLKTDVGSLRNEFQLFRGEMEIRIDRIEGMTNQTRAEMLNLRADFREWKDQLKESMA